MSDSRERNENPAETIRRAAMLISQRAEAATEGPWEHPEPYEITHGYEKDGAVSRATWIATVDAGDENVSDETAEANGEHIASWHPLVAMEVAGWLDSRAGDADSATPANGSWDLTWCDDPAGIESALKIARTYLGEPE